jgi:hypothetical protein
MNEGKNKSTLKEIYMNNNKKALFIYIPKSKVDEAKKNMKKND